MKHLFVPYEIALKLKEKGFDEPCFAGYSLKAPVLFSEIQHELKGGIHKNSEGITASPIYQQVIDWFHKKGYNLHHYWLSDDQKFGCDVYDINGMLLFSDIARGFDGKYTELYEAQNKAIEEALKLIP